MSKGERGRKFMEMEKNNIFMKTGGALVTRGEMVKGGS
jgi:hypothetical protein